MDGGFRAPRPVERRAASRPESASRQQEERPTAEPPRTVHHAATHRTVKEESAWKRFLWPIIVVVVVALCVMGWFMWSRMSSATAIDSSKYQAVFFTNGQVYFGKLHPFNNGYMKLTDVYYLQSQQSSSGDASKNPQQTTNNQNSNNVQLIKLGDEIHGPEDEMIIGKDQMLFYENLKADGKVAQSIEQFKNSKK